MSSDDLTSSTPPSPNHLYVSRLIPHQETVAWKIHNVTTLLQTRAWTSVSIPLQVGLGATELTTWNISLQARHDNRLLCARTMLLSPQEQHRRVTHHLKVAVVEGSEDEGPIYYFPTSTSSANPTNRNNNSNRNANLTNPRSSSGGGETGCMRRALRRIFMKNRNYLEGDDDELIGDGSGTKEARPAHKAPLSLWKIMPLDKIRPGDDDCIELRVTLTVFGCDLEEKRV